MAPIKYRMKLVTINMNVASTLPFRLNRSNLLSSNGIIKTLAFVFFSCFLQLNSGCSRLNEVGSIEVEVWHNGSPLDCNTFENNQQVWSIQQLAFFISEVKMSNENTEHQAQLSSTPWQTNDVVLIQPDLVDCVAKTEGEGKTTQGNQVASEALNTNNHLQFLLPVDLDASKQLSFTLAVPFAQNHQNPLLQTSPLNLPSMFWSWQSGHKFFRLDMQGSNNNWVFHLGSVGCAAASVMRTPQKECEQPNRINFDLDKKHDGTKLIMHIDRLVANTSMQNNDSCLFHSGQESCTILMSNLQTKDVFEWH